MGLRHRVVRNGAVVIVAVAFLSLSLSVLRLFYLNLVNLSCLQDTEFIQGTGKPVASQAVFQPVSAFIALQPSLGNEGSAICLAQRLMLEGKNPHQVASLAADITRLLAQQKPQVKLPIITMALRPISANDESKAQDVLTSYLKVIWRNRYLPFRWMYDDYERAIASVAPDYNEAIAYRSVKDASRCIALSRGQVEWGLPISPERLLAGPCGGSAPNVSATSRSSAFNLLINGGLEWPETIPADPGKIPGWEHPIYGSAEVEGAVARMSDNTVLTIDNSDAAQRKGLSTGKLRLAGGHEYILGATVYPGGGNPYLGMSCSLGGTEVWTWYALQGSLPAGNDTVSAFDTVQIPDQALECYVVTLNLDSQQDVAFDDLFLAQVN